MCIVITTPHSYCQDPIHRDCDEVAGLAGSLLWAKIPGSLFFPSISLRSTEDLNRFPSRNSPYRQQIRPYLNPDTFLLDIHSYPLGTYPSDHYTILDDSPMTEYGWDLYQYLIECGVEGAYLEGSRINDLVEEARSRGSHAILIEFPEYISYHHLEYLTQLIADWVMMQICSP